MTKRPIDILEKDLTVEGSLQKKNTSSDRERSNRKESQSQQGDKDVKGDDQKGQQRQENEGGPAIRDQSFTS